MRLTMSDLAGRPRRVAFTGSATLFVLPFGRPRPRFTATAAGAAAAFFVLPFGRPRPRFFGAAASPCPFAGAAVAVPAAVVAVFFLEAMSWKSPALPIEFPARREIRTGA